MDDKLLFENMLLILKSNMEVYNHGTLESCNPDVRETIRYGLDTTLKLQQELFDEMSLNGWYQISNVDSKKICQTYNKVNK
jgi:spore coat protein CotF